MMMQTTGIIMELLSCEASCFLAAFNNFSSKFVRPF